MALTAYLRKRDFTRTTEPRGGRSAGRTTGRRFVVQKHDASRLHYDFRLELGGVLRSWAVPKGPSLNPADKRLAVEVEDHPIEYAGFEGVIPEGEYGGGTVMLWDVGEWTPLDPDPAAALRKGKLKFNLMGERLRGQWTLTRMSARAGDDRKNWLLIKRRDGEARTGGEASPENHNRSIKTGRDMKGIARDEDAVWSSNGKAERRAAKARSAKPAQAKNVTRGSGPRSRRPGAGAAVFDPGVTTGAEEAAMPVGITPQLCTPAETAPTGDEWIHEIKFDGYRLLAHRTAGGVRLVTRAGHDWTGRFPSLAEAIDELPVDSALIDGEATIVETSGRTSFQALQRAMKLLRPKALVYFAFDLLYCNGHDLRRSPLIERKELLRGLLPREPAGPLRFSDHVAGGGASVRRNACGLGLEGIVSKRADAPYSSGRSMTWLKIKCGRRQEFVVVGFTPPGGSRTHFGSLLLAAHDAEGRLIYTGRVGTGFDEATLADLAARLKRLRRGDSPLAEAPPRAESRGASWVEPRLVAEVSFAEWTDDRRLRQPSFQGLREDKEASAVTIESPGVAVGNGGSAAGGSPAAAAPRSSRAARRRTSAKAPRRAARSKEASPVVAGITITSAGRVVYPEAGITKLDIARYYERVAELMLPYVSERPLSTVRCPSGQRGPCFFQKHLRETFAAPVKSIRVKEKEGEADYIAIDSIPGLISLIQFGVLEIHPWGSRGDRIEQPDMLIFDLDPGEGVAFDAVKAGAMRVRKVLAALDLVSYVKTSGGKGLHVVVPLRRAARWDEAKEFAAAVAEGMAREAPDRYTAVMSKAKRRGRIFVDYLRNGRGATSVAPYSTRARPGAPISMPIGWDELRGLRGPAQFTLAGIEKHLRTRRRDPWEDFFSTRQAITGARLTAAIRAAQ